MVPFGRHHVLLSGRAVDALLQRIKALRTSHRNVVVVQDLRANSVVLALQCGAGLQEMHVLESWPRVTEAEWTHIALLFRPTVESLAASDKRTKDVRDAVRQRMEHRNVAHYEQWRASRHLRRNNVQVSGLPIYNPVKPKGY